MIKRIENMADAPALEQLAARQPDFLAGLWLQAFAQVRGALALYSCGSGVLLAVHGSAGVLTGKPSLAQRRELRACLPLLGVGTLYTADRLLLGLPGRASPLVWMTRAPAAGSPLPVQQSYAAAAQLVCGDLPRQAMMDFYADLCARRNRGLVQVLCLGQDAAPTGCVVLGGPLPAAPNAPATVYFSDLVVAAAHRGQGHSRTLLQGADAACRAMGGARLLLHCAPGMVPFYKKHGWTEGGKIWMRKI